MTKEEKVLGFINNEMKMPLKASEIATMLSVPEYDLAEFNMLIDVLINDNLVIKTKRGKIAPLSSMNLVNGKFIANERGFGFVETDDEKDLFISPCSFFWMSFIVICLFWLHWVLWSVGASPVAKCRLSRCSAWAPWLGLAVPWHVGL